jgi:hypothetical protein
MFPDERAEADVNPLGQGLRSFDLPGGQDEDVVVAVESGNWGDGFRVSNETNGKAV